ncbi:MAG: lysophospholipid acyltransferase family protein [Gemmataceae bacterium]
MARVARLLLLGVGQLSTLIGAVMGGLFVTLEIGRRAGGDGAGLAVLLAAALPALILIPALAALSRPFSRQVVLRWASMYVVFVSLPFAFLQEYWLLWWGLVSLGLAVVLPLRASLAHTAAREMHAGATRMRTAALFYSFAAVFVGAVAGYALSRHEGPGLPLPFGYALGFFALALATTLTPPFRRDQTAPRDAHTGASVWRDVWEAPAFRWALPLGGVIRGGFWALLLWLFLTLPSTLPERLHALTLFILGAAVACLLLTIEGHPRRLLGFLPWALVALAVVLLLAAFAEDPLDLVPALGWIAGFLLPPLHSALEMELHEAERLPAEALRRAADVLAALLWGGLLLLAHNLLGVSVAALLFVLAVFALAGAIAAFIQRRRDTAELVLEGLMLPFWRVHATGPGLTLMPPRGPVILLANHASWFDPIFLGKVSPRKLLPMMTSVFYDSPKLNWLMRLGEAIRVESARFRRETPELDEAVATLDRGQALLVFPEGAMRRRDEQWLRHFGQGIVRILRERPHTPVITCWIEGNWGSYFSYRDGLPTKNKRMDFWRSIRVALAAPRHIDPALLEDQRAARRHLMELVAKTRTLLGLEAAPLQNVHEDALEEEKA